jgi:hypothetical protein
MVHPNGSMSFPHCRVPYLSLAWLAVAFFGLGGCTHTDLRQSTVAAGSTLTDLEYEMVLDNVAMFKSNPNFLPWHLKISQGSVQISDSLNPSLTYNSANPITRGWTIAGGRMWAESWTVTPTVNADELDRLARLYRDAATASWVEEGFAPPGAPCGHYGRKFVWVKSENLESLTTLTEKVLGAAPLKPEERAFLVPGVPSKSP